ncbi:2-C-methyl-D-erythritol 4-phosphate cytidylyltransferase [Microbacterium amylolyticum]|uniref:Bifunctional enzyme IspD/IspF n=1 Tax=Microbacterium amylolyticum TaxID=936337 RepID=A0ABS4ZL80_9MICO|nr:2-C-methyl-D-erythritol 4-phosphate cytidylyltransferase [Microbacterium amylolyticum]MBP2437206.1 2-C-methyl-D-erythritol 4-phosphate cytidylyltransferase/2-C-methyl-D-erythritol 2,4-cyclodiphosphate synthase [Microbacterium amylolyticum]
MSTATRIDTAIIIVAAGSGTRLGAGEPKAFVGIDHHSLLRHCLRGVFEAGPAQVIVVAPQDRAGEALAQAYEAAGDRRELVTTVVGGETRQLSVAAGLSRVWPGVDVVLVHDAARSLVPGDMIDRVVAAVRETGHGAIPVLPVVDTLKRVDENRVVGVVDRSELAAAQTPQGFRRDVLDTAYAVSREEYTDDAALVQAAGHPVVAIEGSARGFKITTPADLLRARRIVADAPVPPVTAGAAPRTPLPRVGIGTDVHAFGGTGSLWLAGIEWPDEPALSGHSDGDSVAHAIVDAVLNAAGLGDIGSHFGTDRPEFAGAHAGAFLAETHRILQAAGWRVGNVSVQVQANSPRFAPRRAEAERVLSDALGAPVSVTATTTDGLGPTGRSEGIQAFAVALVVPV